jgi:hypothetical protein
LALQGPLPVPDDPATPGRLALDYVPHADVNTFGAPADSFTFQAENCVVPPGSVGCVRNPAPESNTVSVTISARNDAPTIAGSTTATLDCTLRVIVADIAFADDARASDLLTVIVAAGMGGVEEAISDVFMVGDTGGVGFTDFGTSLAIQGTLGALNALFAQGLGIDGSGTVSLDVNDNGSFGEEARPEPRHSAQHVITVSKPPEGTCPF